MFEFLPAQFRCEVFLVRNFWENERPSSSDDEIEIECPYYPKIESKTRIGSSGNIEIVKDLNLSKKELKSEIRKLEYKIKGYQTGLRNQIITNSRLKTECEEIQKQSQVEKIKLQNELEALQLNNEFEKTQLQKELEILQRSNEFLKNQLKNDLVTFQSQTLQLRNELKCSKEQFNLLANCE